jgi:hypothetical protein
MAKRTRYPKRTAARSTVKRATQPGATGATEGLRPTRPFPLDGSREPGEDMPLRSSSALTDDEVRRAAELEAEATARERAAIAESLRRRSREQEQAHVDAGDVNAPLSVRAAHEYAYVARDVRRIALTASLMIAILAVLHILVNVLGVISF